MWVLGDNHEPKVYLHHSSVHVPRIKVYNTVILYSVLIMSCLLTLFQSFLHHSCISLHYMVHLNDTSNYLNHCILVMYTARINLLFYHRSRVVTLVANKVNKQWLCLVYFANCIRRLSYNLNLAVSNHWTSVKVTPARVKKHTQTK